MGRHLLRPIPVCSTGALTGGQSRLWGKVIILQGLQYHTSPQTTPCSRTEHRVSFICKSEGMGYLFSPVFFLLLHSLSSRFLWWTVLEWAPFPGVSGCCLQCFSEKSSEVLSDQRNKWEKEGHGYLLSSLQTCLHLCGCAHNLARLSASRRLQSGNAHRELIHHCTDEQEKTMCCNTAKVAVKIQEVTFLSMTPWWSSD